MSFHPHPLSRCAAWWTVGQATNGAVIWATPASCVIQKCFSNSFVHVMSRCARCHLSTCSFCWMLPIMSSLVTSLLCNRVEHIWYLWWCLSNWHEPGTSNRCQVPGFYSGTLWLDRGWQWPTTRSTLCFLHLTIFTSRDNICLQLPPTWRAVQTQSTSVDIPFHTGQSFCPSWCSLCACDNSLKMT